MICDRMIHMAGLYWHIVSFIVGTVPPSTTHSSFYLYVLYSIVPPTSTGQSSSASATGLVILAFAFLRLRDLRLRLRLLHLRLLHLPSSSSSALSACSPSPSPAWWQISCYFENLTAVLADKLEV